MKKILTSKDEFVGKTMNEIISLDDCWDNVKLYMFDDAVLIEKYSSYDYSYHAMEEREILKEAVYVDVELDKICFEYEDELSRSVHGHTIYNITNTKIEITPFGKDMIANGIVTEHELMVYGNEKIAEKTEDIKVERQRDIDECIAVLAKYNINIKTE